MKFRFSLPLPIVLLSTLAVLGFPMASLGSSVVELADFYSAPQGIYPSGITKGADGSFYGTTYGGGTSGMGVVFRLSPDGTMVTLVDFNGDNGRTPGASLIQASDGNFYGTTQAGGASGGGTVFRMTPDGQLTTLVSFTGLNGFTPASGVIQGSDGNFYGTTLYGGQDYDRASNDPRGPGLVYGTIFRLTPQGVLTTLVSLDGANASPAGLVQGKDGFLYGTTRGGGSTYGGIFKVSLAGDFTPVASLTSATGTLLQTALIQDTAGNLYGIAGVVGGYGTSNIFKLAPNGALSVAATCPSSLVSLALAADGTILATTSGGGSANSGTVVKITPSGLVSTVASFVNSTGTVPRGPLVIDLDGTLYGVAANGGFTGGGTIFRLTASGTLGSLFTFIQSLGYYPDAGLTLGSDGYLYGTTSGGGQSQYGTLYKVSPEGDLTTLVEFNGANGRRAGTILVQGKDGNFYGTTGSGGASDDGTVFKLTPAGGLTTLVSFNGTNGAAPNGGLIQATDGNFYGTTSSGGPLGRGTVFKVTPSGDFSTLYAFDDSHGIAPQTGVVQAKDGNLYGTTYNGIFYRLTLGGVITSIASTTDDVTSDLILASDGNMYGTLFGGSNPAMGKVYRLTTDGTFAVLSNVSSGRPGPLIQGQDGILYGTESTNGTSGHGSVFGITLAGKVTSLASFDGTIGTPVGRLARDADGNFYGASQFAPGNVIGGAVYRVSLNAPQTITFPALANREFSFTPISLGATASSGLPITYTVVSGDALVSGNALNLGGLGTVTVAADQSGNGAYRAAPEVTRTFVVLQGTQTISCTTSGTAVYGRTVDISAAPNSFSLVSFSVLSGAAKVSSVSILRGVSTGHILLNGVGKVSIQASLTGGGDPRFKPARPVTINLTVRQATPTLGAWVPLGIQAYPSAPFTIPVPVASSGLPVTLSVLDGPATLSGNLITLTGVGKVTLVATQTGDANNKTVSAKMAFIVRQAQTLALKVPTNVSFGQAPFQVGATSSSGLKVTGFSIVSGPATISGSTVTLSGAGTVVLKASQAGNGKVAPASATASIVVGKASQTITFPAIPGGMSIGTVIQLQGTASSGLAVSYSVAGPAQLSGTTLTLTGPGTVNIKARQLGNADYAAASDVLQRVIVK